MICDLAAYRDRCFLPCHGLSEVVLTVCLMCSSFESVYGPVGLLLRAIGLKICIHDDQIVGSGAFSRHRGAGEHMIKGCRYRYCVGAMDPDLHVATSADPSDKNDQTGSADPCLDRCIC